ncbi:MAG: ornithine cyclodeaminase family protein [Chloroflexi bacterium]|nr:ornithine cyclodeaminase family protein [Chloroflexota bacterium]
MSTLLLGGKDVRKLLNMTEVMEAVEQAFRYWALGKATMPAKAYLVLEHGDFRAMPAALPGCVGMKWVNVHPGNPALGLPTIMALLIYSDPATGYPLAVMDATEITAYRTGATAAIASKYLARQDARTLGIIGAGRQAHTQLAAHALVFPLRQINVFDLSPATTEKFIRSFPDYPVRGTSLEEAAASDIVCTVTPARAPFLKKKWLAPGAHINAIGADAEGKEELEPDILKEAVIVVDDLGQASAAGEVNVPLRKGIISLGNIYGTLGDIITGRKKGRQDSRTVTVFDSTGVAIEDVAVARFIYEKAKQAGGYPSLDIVEG